MPSKTFVMTPRTALPSKPDPCPESQDSPRNTSGQKIFSGEGGVLAIASRDARAVSSEWTLNTNRHGN